MHANAYDLNNKYYKTVSGTSSLKTTFGTGELNVQLKRVAKTIEARSSLGVGRQIFFVGLDGFDTRSRQKQDTCTAARSQLRTHELQYSHEGAGLE